MSPTQVTFIERVLVDLKEFLERILILRGNQNITLDPQLNSSRTVSFLPLSFHWRLQSLLHLHQMGMWRTLNSTEHDYTLFSDQQKFLLWNRLPLQKIWKSLPSVLFIH